MNSMHDGRYRKWECLFVWLACLAFSGVGGISAQAEGTSQQPPESVQEPLRSDVSITIEGTGRPRVPLALPRANKPGDLPIGGNEALAELETTLRSDLELTGIFDIQGPEQLSVLTLTGDRDRDFMQYASLGNEVILFADVTIERDRLVLEGRMYDLAGKSFIFGKRYAGTFDLVRRIAHSLSDEISLYWGQRGIALTNLAFTSDRDGNGIKELYLMDYDGFNQRRISGHQSLSFSPDWAPNGDGLAYVSYFQGSASLYWVNRLNGEKSPILVDDRMNLSPSVSPDGARIALSRSVDGNREIFTCRLDGSDLRRITTSGGIDTNAAWSPRNDLIAFTSSRSGSPQIYVMKIDGSEVRRVSFDGKYNDGASWHPSDSKLAYATRSPDGTRFDIAVTDLETGETNKLTTGPGSHEAPSFSPNGRLIAFESSMSGGKQIVIVSLDGRVFRQLTRQGQNYGPAWSNYLK